MLLEVFRGRKPHEILSQARASLGEDAWVVCTRDVVQAGAPVLEMVVAPGVALLDLTDRLDPPTPRWPARTSSLDRPHIVALVGPTGVGKTTTAAKLAVHPDAYGQGRPGLLCLDTYRVAAVEQLGAYADAAGIPMEVVYGLEDLDGALTRLGACDVIVVDTPGRATADAASHAECVALLERLAPDEVHLLVPGYLDARSAAQMTERYAAYHPTHLLPTKTDEAWDPTGAAQIVLVSELRCRWVTVGSRRSVRPRRHPGSSCSRPSGSGPTPSTHGRVA